MNPAENEIYESLSMRMTLHLHYLLPESWHQDRQLAVLEAIKKINPSTTVDMGFGAPTRYIREFILLNKKVLLLTDLYPSAFIFSQALFNFLSKNWKSFISFKQLSIVPGTCLSLTAIYWKALHHQVSSSCFNASGYL